MTQQGETGSCPSGKTVRARSRWSLNGLLASHFNPVQRLGFRLLWGKCTSLVTLVLEHVTPVLAVITLQEHVGFIRSLSGLGSHNSAFCSLYSLGVRLGSLILGYFLFPAALAAPHRTLKQGALTAASVRTGGALGEALGVCAGCEFTSRLSRTTCLRLGRSRGGSGCQVCVSGGMVPVAYSEGEDRAQNPVYFLS